MTTQIQPPQARNWQERLKDSSWVTIGWEWLQVLLGRSVDFVLWTTMIFSCYQLIPGPPQAPAGVSTFMFILQFIALDIGGLGLNRLAQQQGLSRWAYARVVAYILIGITLVTISYAGIEHAVTVPLEITGWIEAMLVIARSIMTVLYGQAIHSLKAQEQSMRDHLAELEEQATLQQQQLDSGQQEVSSLRVQLDTLQQQAFSGQQEVSTLRVQLDSEQGKVSSLQEQLDSGQRDTSALRTQLNVAHVEVDTLRAQLDGKKQELESLRETVSSGQEWQESRVRRMLETEQQRVSDLQQQLTDEQNAVVGLRRELNAALVEADRLRTQVEVKQREVEGVQAVLKTEQQEASSLRVQLNTLQQQASSSGVQLDSPSSGQAKVDTGQRGKVVRLDMSRPRKSGQDAAEHAMAEQVRELLTAEPGLSGRALAARLGCSPTTAAKWKGIIETERDAVNQ